MMKRELLFFLSVISAGVTAEPVSYVCNYATYSNEQGNHAVDGDFSLMFVVHPEKGSAYIVGNMGTEEVLLIPHAMGGMGFIDMTNSGNIMTTAIDMKGNSVHSRNTSIGAELMPSQYYGRCRRK